MFHLGFRDRERPRQNGAGEGRGGECGVACRHTAAAEERAVAAGVVQPERVVHDLRTDAAIISFVVGIIATIIATTIIIPEVRNKPLPPGQADREQSGDTPPLPCVPTAFAA